MRLYWLFSGRWRQLQAAAVKVDCRREVVEVSKASRRVFDPLDFRVDAFAGGIGDSMLQIRQDVRQVRSQRFGRLDNWFQPAVCGPAVPPLEMIPSRAFVPVFP